jgi:ankyrin repeat protein
MNYARHTNPPSPLGTSGSGKLEIGLNLNVEDGDNETALSLALWTEHFSIAQQLIKSGADIECVDREEPGLLYVAILREMPMAAMFLLENGADYKKR